MGENSIDLALVSYVETASLVRAIKIMEAELVRRDMSDDSLFGRATD